MVAGGGTFGSPLGSGIGAATGRTGSDFSVTRSNSAARWVSGVAISAGPGDADGEGDGAEAVIGGGAGASRVGLPHATRSSARGAA